MFRRFLSWKWLGRFALIGVVLAVAVPLTVRTVMYSQGESRLAAAVRRLDEADPGWTLDDLCAARNAALPPPERNGYAAVKRARDAFPRPVGREMDAVSDAVWGRPANVGLRPDETAALAKHLDEYAASVATARQVADLPDGGRPVTFPPLPLDLDLTETQRVREVMGLLSRDAAAAAQAGRRADAVRSVRAGLNTSRAIGDEPTAISQLVRTAGAAIACRSAARVLGQCEPTDADGLATLQAEFLRDADVPRNLYAMRGERASVHRMFQLMESGEFFNSPSAAAATGGPTGLLQRSGLWLIRGYLPTDHLCTLNLMTAAVDAARLPFDQQQAAFKAIPQPPKGDVRFVFSNLLCPAIEKVNDTGLRVRGQLLATAAGIACERHRRRTGAWPATLAAIPTDLLPAVPTDPFTGRPLAYKHLADGVVVYTVGPDGKDDGGAVDADPDTNKPPTDFGIRLWDPAARRAAPPPPKPNDDPAVEPGTP